MKKIITLSVLFFGTLFLAGCGQQPAVDLATLSKNIPADWKTYADQENGFELKYPASWIFTNDNLKIIEKKGRSIFDAYLTIKTSDYTSGDKPGQSTGALFFLDAVRQKTIDGVIIPIVECKDYPGLKLTDCPAKSSAASLIKISGVTALSAKINNVSIVQFTNNGYSYSLHFLRSKNFQGKDELFNQIISTFKLIK